jgi:hypothetical protein
MTVENTLSGNTIGSGAVELLVASIFHQMNQLGRFRIGPACGWDASTTPPLGDTPMPTRDQLGQFGLELSSCDPTASVSSPLSRMSAARSRH